ncbi:hypothetical protein NLU13_1705 [Sarocladium strictum]|uniref:Uncharacterized protein n=1 Tax=Sarocladium strictum TaxID=5046 RepID=A0AA39LCI6_SARSR|nr:hypothetical protein NLU13_1705 [Sarocladium strictum]
MKLPVIATALLLGIPVLAQEQVKPAAVEVGTSQDSAKSPEAGSDHKLNQDEPNKEFFELIYANSEEDGRPGSAVAVEDVLTYGTVEIDAQPHHHHGYRPQHRYRPSHCGECSHQPQHPHKPYYPEHNKKPGNDVLTDCFLCKKLNLFADELYYVSDIVWRLKCRDGKPVWKAIYLIESQLDELDKLIDKSPLDSCFDCRQESKIACCYKTYAEALIRLLDAISEKSEYLPGEVDKYLVTAINSLRSADSTFVYELARRMQCDEYIKEIMKKQGARDGSTQGSISEAFALIVSTPYITGETLDKDSVKSHEKKQGTKRSWGIVDFTPEQLAELEEAYEQVMDGLHLIAQGTEASGFTEDDLEDFQDAYAKVSEIVVDLIEESADKVEDLELEDLPTAAKAD